MNKHIIDCNATPILRVSSFKIEEHKKGGKLEWDPTKVSLWLAQDQQSGQMEGGRLREELRGKSVLNANVFDFLLDNERLIPDEWRMSNRGGTNHILFWGTIFRSSDDDRYVRYLGWNLRMSMWSYGAYRLNNQWNKADAHPWLKGQWCSFEPAAVLNQT